MRHHGHTLLFWLGLIALAPLLLWQGRRATKTIPRLPEAAGDLSGVVDHAGASRADAPLRVLFVGESTAVGVGVAHRDDSLVGHTSRQLARRSGRAVHWTLLGHNGATAAELLPRVGTLAADCDLVLLAIGANDAKALRSPQQWRDDLATLVQALQQRTGASTVCISAMPPMGQFPALPQPLRWLLGVQARRLDLVTQALCRQRGDLRHVVVDFGPFRPELFAGDGFHPSGAGYARWAECLADAAGI